MSKLGDYVRATDLSGKEVEGIYGDDKDPFTIAVLDIMEGLTLCPRESAQTIPDRDLDSKTREYIIGLRIGLGLIIVH